MKTKPRKHPGGRPAHINLAVVKRVSQRFARGVPLRLACEAEAVAEINEESFKRHLKRHPSLLPLYRGARAQFIEAALKRALGVS